jgi:F-type H+-transporting ATPase subunit delta
MSNGSLAKRYARALFALGEELNLVEQFNTEVKSFTQTLSLNNDELLTALTTPIFKVEERKQVVNVVCEKLGLHQIVQNFIYVLLDKDRLSLQNEISDIFQTMADVKAGRVRASVRTATSISDSEQTEIAETLAQSLNIASENLIVEFDIRPELIGGVWAKVGDRTYDATVLSKIQDMKSALLNR